MNYQQIYNQLIEKRKLNPVTEGYKENHHILPKSLGGKDTKDNLVTLTGREHWVAHLLLHKIHKKPQTAHACNMMAMRCDERGIPRIRNSRVYEYVRKEHAKYISSAGKKRIGKKNGSYGTMWICNIELKENKKISKDEEIPKGWIKGRSQWNQKKRINIHSSEFSEIRRKHMKRRRKEERLQEIETALKYKKIITEKFKESGYKSFSKFAKEYHKEFGIGYGSMYKYFNFKGV